MAFGQNIRLDVAPFASYLGINSDSHLGRTLANVGDVNGDGLDDFAMGGWDGIVYLILGKTSGWALNVSISNADASFVRDREDSLPTVPSVAGGGDINGDGYDDILVGDPNYERDGEYWWVDIGAVFIIPGRSSGWAMNTDLESMASSIIGKVDGEHFGSYIAGAGDVNGDGYDDILMGAPWNDTGGEHAGQTFLFFGQGRDYGTEVPVSDADASYIGQNAFDESGTSVSGVGDVNGDGFDDFMIGSPYNDVNGGGSGQAYLKLGGTTGWELGTSLSFVDASFHGYGQDDWAGMALSTAGDVNGDGYDDIIVSAPNLNNGVNNDGCGGVYLILGKPTGWAMNDELDTSDASFRGQAYGEFVGYSISGGGDVDGNGYDDFIAGSHMRMAHRGYTYLIEGASNASDWLNDVNIRNTPVSFFGETEDSDSGLPVAIAGDVNGDGYDDILISANDYPGDVAVNGKVYVISPDSNSRPSAVQSVDIYSDSGCTNKITGLSANMLDTVYVELVGTDTNGSRNDTALVNVRSNISNLVGFTLKLLETGPSTGIYHGELVIMNRTDKAHQWIEAWDGETVIVTSLRDPAKIATLDIVGQKKPIVLYPLSDLTTALEDTEYFMEYWTLDWPSAVWTFDTDATWLDWDPLTQTMSGTPENSHVGTFNVSLRITNFQGSFDQHDFQVPVQNVAPNITSLPLDHVKEDEPYYFEFNATDEGQGATTWTMEASNNAKEWLTLNSTTGVLEGTPTNDHVRVHPINITFSDGNGGTDSLEFDLNVTNINDYPQILTESLPNATQDVPYTANVVAVDIDPGDQAELRWKVTYEGEDCGFLDFDMNFTYFHGTPSDDHVGICWVRVHVSDPHGYGTQKTYKIDILNVNDPPVIIGNDTTTTYEDMEYRVDYNVTDKDFHDQTFNWSIQTEATWLSIYKSTGIIIGTPTNDDVGSHEVTVTVKDPWGASANRTFTLEVLNVNDPPVFTTKPGFQFANVTDCLSFDVNANDIDKEDVLTFSLADAPAGVVINATSGGVTWTPTYGQEGWHNISIAVTDGNVTTKITFEVKVMTYLWTYLDRALDGKKVKGRIVINGTTTGPHGKVVQVYVGDEPMDVIPTPFENGTPSYHGTQDWALEIDTKKLKNGKYEIRVRTEWEGKRSEELTMVITVKNEDTSDMGVGLILPILLICAVVGIIIIVIYVVKLRKRPEPPQDDTREIKSPPTQP